MALKKPTLYVQCMNNIILFILSELCKMGLEMKFVLIIRECTSREAVLGGKWQFELKLRVPLFS